MEPPAEAGLPPCPRCGTPPEDRYQEYCLECGSRLVRYPAAGATVFSRGVWARQSPLWMWLPLAALLVVALLVTGVVLAFGQDEEKPKREARPTTGGGISIVTGTTGPPPLSTFTATTVPTTTFATTTTATTTTNATTTTPVSSTIISWPQGKNGYTIVLASVPKERGRDAAERKAREAIDKGLREVGVLDSNDYSSLNPGYYVVFTGVYDTEQEAENGLTGARAAGYPLAYVREIRPR